MSVCDCRCTIVFVSSVVFWDAFELYSYDVLFDDCVWGIYNTLLVSVSANARSSRRRILVGLLSSSVLVFPLSPVIVVVVVIIVVAPATALVVPEGGACARRTHARARDPHACTGRSTDLAAPWPHASTDPRLRHGIGYCKQQRGRQRCDQQPQQHAGRHMLRGDYGLKHSRCCPC